MSLLPHEHSTASSSRRGALLEAHVHALVQKIAGPSSAPPSHPPYSTRGRANRDLGCQSIKISAHPYGEQVAMVMSWSAPFVVE